MDSQLILKNWSTIETSHSLQTEEIQSFRYQNSAFQGNEDIYIVSKEDDSLHTHTSLCISWSWFVCFHYRCISVDVWWFSRPSSVCEEARSQNMLYIDLHSLIWYCWRCTVIVDSLRLSEVVEEFGGEAL